MSPVRGRPARAATVEAVEAVEVTTGGAHRQHVPQVGALLAEASAHRTEASTDPTAESGAGHVSPAQAWWEGGGTAQTVRASDPRAMIQLTKLPTRKYSVTSSMPAGPPG